MTFKAQAFFVRGGSADSDEGDGKLTAQEVQDELVQVLNSVPEKFRYTKHNEDLLSERSSSPPPMTSLLPPHARNSERLRDEDAMLLAQRCDLIITIYYTIMRLHVPRINLANIAQPTSPLSRAFDDSFYTTGPHIANLRAVSYGGRNGSKMLEPS